MPLNPACARRSYSPPAVRVRTEAVQRYIHALQEDNAHFLELHGRSGLVAPPLYAAVLALPAVCDALADPALGVTPTELLPRGCDFQFAQPIRAAREIAISASFDDVTRTEEGEETAILLEGARRGGVPVFAGAFRLLLPAKPGTDPALQPASHFLRPPLAFRAQYNVVPNARRLLPESPDGGLPAAAERFLGQTLGLCYAAKAVIDASLKRDPAQLKRISARPLRPPEPREPIVIAGWIMEARRDTTFFGFEILAEDGSLIMADGRAEMMLA